ncbi:fungal-specific transcription factor domain-domain-containing protein [Aspergillus taichungensis]|uniref:Fungal-specific transcription factor domain-domain-containing protein n=1 Tax=Aspergillus taichungensis TaxID=482145 RepID=A0A2J5IA18_9EURO|nr:fungal-specific transcription factor domain-domain-containing protein [Aspergillus taichungensis]
MDQNSPSPFLVNVLRDDLYGGTDPNVASSWHAGMSPGSSWAPPSGGAEFTPYAMPPPQFYEPSMLHAPPPPTPSYDFPMPAAPPKVPIPRASGFGTHSQRRRSARACEPCRQRKIKCDGTRPSCKQCVENQVKCFYLDVKRVREQKELGALAKKVERYERLLEELESDVDDASARRIRRALSADPVSVDEPTSESEKSDSSIGSLDDIDLVDEDLNRSEKTIAMGFFGKNSEVSWMQKLEDEASLRSQDTAPDDAHPDQQQQQQQQQQAHGSPPKHTDQRTHHHKPGPSIATMSYHLDDLSIPFLDHVDAYALPPKPLADRLFSAYMESVHPGFNVIRKSTFLAQYRQFYRQPSHPPPRWLAILNMIFAIGCRYCCFTDSAEDPDCDDLVYLTRARKLSLGSNVLFEHADLQQIQAEFLAALYLVVMGQVNRAFKFSSVALRSAVSLGINLRFVDDRTHHAAKEARSRLWWSIYLLEHLLTTMTGRVSCVGEDLSATPLPIPFEEEDFGRADVQRLFHNPNERAHRLKLTLLQSDEEAKVSAEWLAQCEPSASLFFHCLVDLATITQAIITKIYSIHGLRERSSKVERRIRRYSHTLDLWLAKVPPAYRFDPVPPSSQSPTTNPLAGATTANERERVSLAISFYSSRLTLCRPCLTHTTWRPAPQDSGIEPPGRLPPRAQLRYDLARTCLQSACSLISILPDTPDMEWLARTTPWWSILHFVMQATTALLLGLSCWPSHSPDSEGGRRSRSRSSSATRGGRSESAPRQDNFPNQSFPHLSGTTASSSTVTPGPGSSLNTNTGTSTPNTSISGASTARPARRNPARRLSSFSSAPSSSTSDQHQHQHRQFTPPGGTGHSGDELSIPSLIRHTKKAFIWLYEMGRTTAAARRAFLHCDSFLRRIAPSLGLDVSDWPGAESLPVQPSGAGEAVGLGAGKGVVSGDMNGDGDGL